MHFDDPLLCLTVSTTLREKPVPLTDPRRRLADLITATGDFSLDPASPIPGPDDGRDPAGELASGLEEVNLLGTIASGGPHNSICANFLVFTRPRSTYIQR